MTKRSIKSSEELRLVIEDDLLISTFGIEYTEPFGICELRRHIIQRRHVIMLSFNPLIQLNWVKTYAEVAISLCYTDNTTNPICWLVNTADYVIVNHPL